MLAGLLLGGAAASIALLSPWPVAAVFLFFLAIASRSAWKARWKTNDRLALLLYGVHSHLQQVPIYVGQLQYKWNRRKGKRSLLVEYKQP